MFTRCPFFNRGNLEKSKLHEKEFLRSVERTIISTECFFGFSGLFFPNLEKREKILEKKNLNIEKFWKMSKLSGKIFPYTWKNFSGQLELKLKLFFFFPSRKVSGKKFEQFCCPQKSPEQSRKNSFLKHFDVKTSSIFPQFYGKW